MEIRVKEILEDRRSKNGNGRFFSPKSDEFQILIFTSSRDLPTNDERIYRELRKTGNIHRENFTKLRDGKLLIKSNTEITEKLKKIQEI